MLHAATRKPHTACFMVKEKIKCNLVTIYLVSLREAFKPVAREKNEEEIRVIFFLISSYERDILKF